MVRRLAAAVRRLRDDRDGLGAVEFALIAPVLLLLFVGTTELSMAITVGRKVQSVAAAVNDLASQSDKLSRTELQALLRLAGTTMAPYPVAPLKVTMIAVKIDGDGKATVAWSCGSKGTTLPNRGDGMTLPAPLKPLRDRTMLVTQTHYAYKPVTGTIFGGPIDLSGISYLNPRYSSEIASSGCSDAAL